MESSRLDPIPANGTHRFPMAPIVSGVIVAVIAVWITVATAIDRDPEEVVEEYLSAIVEKDVEGALRLVTRFGYGVTYGDEAAFLTSEAIGDDWWVVSVAEVGREYGTARVKAVIGGPGGTAEGEFAVEEYDDEWLLSDPFVRVQFPASSLSYVQINDEIVAKPRGTNAQSYVLFPGPGRFYQSVADVVDTPRTGVVAAFPAAESASDLDAREVVPPALAAGKRTVEKAQRVVEQRIDDCAGFATQAPYGVCPFATDGEIDTPDGKRVTDLHGLTWTVKRYPVVAMADDRSDEYNPGFALRATEPGTMTLSGSGLDTDGNPATFTVTCDIDVSGYLATVGADGDVTLTGFVQPQTATTFNTCRRNA